MARKEDGERGNKFSWWGVCWLLEMLAIFSVDTGQGQHSSLLFFFFLFKVPYKESIRPLILDCKITGEILPSDPGCYSVYMCPFGHSL